jgi:hypothetical protein
MKVTVIATGFPTDMPKRSLFQMGQTKGTEVPPSPKEDILQIFKKDTSKETPTEYVKKPEKKEEAEEEIFIDDTEDWSTVPAFLRRNKK